MFGKGSEEDEEEDGETRPKKKKAKVMFTNEKVILECKLREGEDFQKVFMDAPSAEKPSKVCLKWEIQGQCHKNCNKKKAHWGITEDQKRDLIAFVKKRREKFGKSSK